MDQFLPDYYLINSFVPFLVFVLKGNLLGTGRLLYSRLSEDRVRLLHCGRLFAYLPFITLAIGLVSCLHQVMWARTPLTRLIHTHGACCIPSLFLVQRCLSALQTAK